VCAYDGGYVTTGGYNEIFLKGAGEPNYPCGANPHPGQTPYVPPLPSPPVVLPTPKALPTPH
jgi:hypothetical protein